MLGLSNDMTGFVVMSINNKTGLVDKYAYITNNEVEWGLGKLKKPEGFVFGTSASGFGAAFTYIEADDSQRIFMSANSARRRPHRRAHASKAAGLARATVASTTTWRAGAGSQTPRRSLALPRSPGRAAGKRWPTSLPPPV